MTTNRKNPTGVRTVTIIVTHENPDRDFSRTYTTKQISPNTQYVDTITANPNEIDTREWTMTTYENLPNTYMDHAWSHREKAPTNHDQEETA